MLSAIEVICFVACYIFVFLLEVLRFRFKQNSIWRVVSLALLLLGVFIHGVSLYQNNLLQNDHFFASASGWFSVLAFGLILVQVYLSLIYPKTQFGLFLLPLAFIVLILGWCASDVAFPEATTCRWVRIFHAGSWLLATLISLLGTVTGAMFFVQRYRLKHKIFSTKLTLPSLEWLGCGTRHATNVSILFLGIGVICGFYLKAFASEDSRQETTGLDPVIIGATVLFFTALFLRVRRFWRKDPDVNAHDATLSFVFCVALFILLLFAAFENQGHWRGLIPAQAPKTSSAAADMPNSVTSRLNSLTGEMTAPTNVYFHRNLLNIHLWS